MSFEIPVSILLTRKLASNTLFCTTYIKSAKNSAGERADSLNYEVGQSFVWFAKPKFNIFVETMYERSQEVVGRGITKNEHSLLISPAVRWGTSLKTD